MHISRLLLQGKLNLSRHKLCDEAGLLIRFGAFVVLYITLYNMYIIQTSIQLSIVTDENKWQDGNKAMEFRSATVLYSKLSMHSGL